MLPDNTYSSEGSYSAEELNIYAQHMKMKETCMHERNNSVAQDVLKPDSDLKRANTLQTTYDHDSVLSQIKGFEKWVKHM